MAVQKEKEPFIIEPERKIFITKEISMGNPMEEAELFITKGNMSMMEISEIQELQDTEFTGIIKKVFSMKDSGRIQKCKKEN